NNEPLPSNRRTSEVTGGVADGSPSTTSPRVPAKGRTYLNVGIPEMGSTAMPLGSGIPLWLPLPNSSTVTSLLAWADAAANPIVNVAQKASRVLVNVFIEKLISKCGQVIPSIAAQAYAGQFSG